MRTRILFLPLVLAGLLTVQSCCIFKPVQLGGLNPSGAQSINRQEYWEPVIALTKTSIRGSESWQDPIGFQAGADYPVAFIGSSLCLRAGALVSFQGAAWEYPDLEGRVNLWYVYVPVVMRYQHESGFYGAAGLQPGFLLSAKDKYEETTDNYMSHMNKFDLSIPLIIGYNFKNRIGVNLRVIPGVTDITQDEDEKDVNFVMGIGATYSFGIK